MQAARLLRRHSCPTLSNRVMRRMSIFSLPKHLLRESEVQCRQTLAYNIPGPNSIICKFYSTIKLANEDVKRKVEDLADSFQEAMELVDDARDSVGTIYFTEDMIEAENAISKVIQDYEKLLNVVNDEQRRNVIRTIGLKMEELKSQAEMVKESVKE